MGNDAFEAVCKALERQTGFRPRGGGNRRKGICPAHDDDKPSLSIRNDVAAGLIGVTCFAGCDFDQIVQALGMTPAEFRINGTRVNGHPSASRSRPRADPPKDLGTEIERYPYTDRAGNILYYNIRYEPKDFRMAGPDGRIRRNMKFDRVPFNLPKLLDAIATGRTVYWVEGERDVKSLETLGEVATTSAGGANVHTNPILVEWAQYLVGADLVVIADKDSAGREYAKAVARMAINTASQVRIAESATPQPKSDVTDHLSAGYSLDRLVWQSMRSIRRVRWTVAQILATKPEPLRWVLPGIIPEGLTLLVGAPKVGKSWWNLNLLAALASGSPQEIFGWGQAIDPSPSLYLALEDPQRRVHDRLHKVIRGMNFPADTAGEIWLDTAPILDGGQDEIEQWLEANPTSRALMVDVLAKVRGTPDSSGSMYQADYRAIEPLKAIADRYGIGVIVTHHDRKRPSDDFLDMVSGTKGVTGAADTILYLQRERGKSKGTLKVESRDVEDAVYAVNFMRELGRWHIIDRVEESEDETGEVSLLDQISQVILARGESSIEDLAEIIGTGAQAVKRTCLAAEKGGQLAQTASGLWYVPRSV